jgi:hypothetical protein
MKNLQWVAIGALALAATACTSWDKYAAGQSQKYSGKALFTLYEEWGTPISRTRLVTGGRFYRFRKPATDCEASVWANELDVVVQVTVAGPSTCSAGR